MQTENLVRDLQARFDEAELNADRGVLRELIADGFVSIGPKGFLLDKQAWIDRHDLFHYDALGTSDVDVRVFGDTAIVRDIQRNKATYKDQKVELSVRVSQTWVKQDGAWKLAGIQFSPMPDETKH